jgi:hydroxyethylthiazole kinase-like uncharacterized protein yjeF
MQVLTVAQMRETDRRCIEDLGIPGTVLMNNAGAAVFAEVRPGVVGIVCGRGNNGGDGFVVARLALLAGQEVRVVLVGTAEELRGDARLYHEVFVRLGGQVESVHSGEEAVRAVAALADCDTVVDALLGTGFSGNLRSPYRDCIEALPAVYTVAVDVPSGLNADTGAAPSGCVRADTTVTFHAAKPGLLAPEAQPYVGRLVVAEIGIPEVCGDDVRWAALKSSWERME